MTKEELNKIIEDQKDLKNLPNNNLITMMDILSLEFDEVKKNLISMTFHLDKIEELYDNSLKEYQTKSVKIRDYCCQLSGPSDCLSCLSWLKLCSSRPKFCIQYHLVHIRRQAPTRATHQYCSCRTLSLCRLLSAQWS